jgi:hypothetical protein
LGTELDRNGERGGWMKNLKRKGAETQRRKEKKKQLFLSPLRLCVFAPLRFFLLSRQP